MHSYFYLKREFLIIMNQTTTTNISFDDMQLILQEILQQEGMNPQPAGICATILSKSTLDGVFSHGINRFPLFVRLIREGHINLNIEPEKVWGQSTFERWDGKLGAGMLNASICMERAITLAKTHGMSCVALRNNNHWMRGGSYGWQAVEAGCAAICFTNTKPNMPAWGSTAPSVGNNPLIIAVPREKGPVVLDMSMSLFSYGKMETYRLNQEELPFEGGYDDDGNLTKDPSAIIKTERCLPVGFWKGSGLSILLDVMAAVLSEGKSVQEIGKEAIEYGLSQVFICFDLSQLTQMGDDIMDGIVQSLHDAPRVDAEKAILYPGERTLKTRQRYLKEGIPVNSQIWEQVIALKK